MATTLEDRFRRAVRARMARGRRDAVAQAADHADGSWVTNWLAGKQKHASLDEIAAMARELKIPLDRLLTRSDADADADWAVYGAMALVPRELKDVALGLIVGLQRPGVIAVAPAPTASAKKRPTGTDRKVRQAK